MINTLMELLQTHSCINKRKSRTRNWDYAVQSECEADASNDWDDGGDDNGYEQTDGPCHNNSNSVNA